MKIYKKYLKVIQAIKVVGKNATNPFTNSKYASLTNILNTVQPELQKRGLVLKFDFPKLENEIYQMRVTLIDTVDESGEDQLPLGDIIWNFSIPHDQTQKNKTQGFGSTMTYAQRYAYAMIFQIPFDADDPDASKEPGTNAEKTAGEPEKDWLDKGTTAFAEAVKFIVNGGTVDQIRKKYKVSKAIETLLNNKAKSE